MIDRYGNPFILTKKYNLKTENPFDPDVDIKYRKLYYEE
jgi:hypothetical protein